MASDNLTTEIWRCVRPDGSERFQLVRDVNAGRLDQLDPHVILDALDELVSLGDVRVGDDDRLRRGEPYAVELSAVERTARAEALGMSVIEARLDDAWPRSGGRREIIRALADEVKEMLDAATRNP